MPRVQRARKTTVPGGPTGDILKLCTWCKGGRHNECRPKTQRFYFDNKRGKTVLVWLDEHYICNCKNCHKET